MFDDVNRVNEGFTAELTIGGGGSSVCVIGCDWIAENDDGEGDEFGDGKSGTFWD